MRLAGIVLAIALGPGVAGAGEIPAAKDQVLVATQHVEPASYEWTLAPKVGTIRATEERDLAFVVTGRLDHIVEEGTRVEMGATIAHLNDALEKAEVRRAEAQLQRARRDLTRLRKLRRSLVGTQAEVDNAETAVALRRAELDIAREQLLRRTIVAPFRGAIVDRAFEPGEVVAPGSPVLTLMALNPVEVVAAVPGYDVARLRPEASAYIQVSALPGERFEGIVRRLANATLPGTRLFEVEVELPNPEARLRPGMTALVAIVAHTYAEAIVIPLDSIVQRGSEWVAFFAVAGRARGVRVQQSLVHGERVILLEGAPSTELVVRGQRDLSEGAALRVDNRVLLGAASR